MVYLHIIILVDPSDATQAAIRAVIRVHTREDCLAAIQAVIRALTRAVSREDCLEGPKSATMAVLCLVYMAATQAVIRVRTRAISQAYL